MRTGRASSGTDLGHHLTDMDSGADFDDIARIVSIAGHVAVAMIDFDNVAIAIAYGGKGHNPFGHGEYVATQRNVKIDAEMD